MTTVISDHSKVSLRSQLILENVAAKSTAK